MAKGYPDYFGFSFFPTYGSITRLNTGSVVFQPGESKYIIDLTFHGLIMGGYLRFYNVANPNYVRLTIYRDNSPAIVKMLHEFYSYGFTNYCDEILYLRVYRVSEGQYVLCYDRNYPIEEKFRLRIQEASGLGTITVQSELSYTIIKS